MSTVKRFQDITTNKLMQITAIAAFALAAIGANQLCIFWYHQPKMPDQVRMLKSR